MRRFRRRAALALRLRLTAIASAYVLSPSKGSDATAAEKRVGVIRHGPTEDGWLWASASVAFYSAWQLLVSQGARAP
jgi:hypothetical protein